ncbi:MAG: carbohydrate kinase [Meiothermus sp.]
MIIVAGEALIDLSPLQVEGRLAYLPHPGGSPYNVALGAGRLGAPVRFLGRISSDGFGQLLRAHIRQSGVDLEYVVEGPELTTLALVTPTESGEFFSFYCQNTADTLLRPQDLPAHLPQGAALHFGSISLLLEPTASTLEGLMTREAGRRLISLDPNVRPFLIPDKAAYLGRLEGWLCRADLVKVSQADLEWLYPGRELEAIAAEWKGYGPALVIVTQGGRGAFAWTGGELLRVAAPKITVADTVGAGDAFMGACLAWLWRAGALSRAGLERLSSEQVRELLGFAGRVAAITCTRPGADPPWQGELA